jgi:anti-anti-sigma factor
MLKPRVEVQDVNGVMVAEFWDCLRLDSGAVQDLRSKFEARLRNGGRAELIVDLLGVGFAGSASLGHFVALHRIARAKGGRLVFCNVDPTVFEVFRVSKLDGLYDFVSDRAAALALVEGGGTARGPALYPPASGNAPASPTTNSGGTGLLRSSQRRKLS